METGKCIKCGSEWHWIWVKNIGKCLNCGGELKCIKTSSAKTADTKSE
jgi:rRNA maturation endonuclease Nob1